MSALSKGTTMFSWLAVYKKETLGAALLGISIVTVHYLVFYPIELLGWSTFISELKWYHPLKLMYWSTGVSIFVGVPLFSLILLKKIRPWWAETKIWLNLAVIAQPYGAQIFRRIFVQNEEHSLEYDIILVCTKGIFVLEVKSSQGILHGDPSKPMWIQTMGSALKPVTHETKNPLFQNAPKVRELRNILSKSHPEAKVKSLVFFTNASLELEPPTNVVFNDLTALKNYLKKMPATLSLAELKGIGRLFEKNFKSGKKARAHHMKLIEEKYRKVKPLAQQANTPESD